MIMRLDEARHQYRGLHPVLVGARACLSAFLKRTDGFDPAGCGIEGNRLRARLRLIHRDDGLRVQDLQGRHEARYVERSR